MNTEDIELIKKTERLRLKFWPLLLYYSSVGIFVIFLFLLLYKNLIIRDLGANEITTGLLILLIGFPLAIIFYLFRKRQLKFYIINTILKADEIEKAINHTAKKLDWKILEKKDNYVIAETEGFYMGYGQNITIILDSNRVLINSICFLPSVYGFFGANEDNVNLLERYLRG